MWLGQIGGFIFAPALPMTRPAVGAAGDARRASRFVSAAGAVIGFPLFLVLVLRDVESMHVAALRERLDAASVAFRIAVIATVFLGRRTPMPHVAPRLRIEHE